MLYLPTQHAATLASLIIAILYSALSGFSLPTLRASIMLAFYNLFLLKRHEINPWHIWSLTLFALLLINPLTVLNQSFWLSLITIAILIYTMQGRLAPRGAWWKWGRAQVVITIGLIPLSLLYFQQISLIAFIANIIAIPIITILLPICSISGYIFISILHLQIHNNHSRNHC